MSIDTPQLKALRPSPLGDPEAAAILKKLGISTPKPLLHVG